MATVRRIEIRALFPLNLRQFALTDFKKPHEVKKLEEKTKRMALVPSKSVHPFRFCEVRKGTRQKMRWEKTSSISYSFAIPIFDPRAFFSMLQPNELRQSNGIGLILKLFSRAFDTSCSFLIFNVKKKRNTSQTTKKKTDY